MKIRMNAFGALALSVAVAMNAHAGGNLDTFKFTGNSTIDGFEDVEVVPIRWDPRCANVAYTLDTVLPNAGTENEIDIETTRAELQTALDSWNQIDTSFINMNITQVREIGNGLRGFDFINELTFETADDFTALASSPSTSLQEDTEFNVGDDIDGDGDSDVFDPDVAGINVCTDIDNDGDIEFPAGFYVAGTILDNDVQFGATVNWSTEASADPSADIQAVAVHEFGHSHGLSHAAINVISAQDGSGSTMFPFIDTNDGAAEEATRSPHEDDIAWSSFNYPEGSQSTGAGALDDSQGDQAFSQVYAVLSGSVAREDGSPVVGASVFAVHGFGQAGQTMVEANTGEVLVLADPDGNLLLAPEVLGAVDGDFEIPVRRGNYRIGVQALDGSPFEGNRVSVTANVGFLYGQQNFSEEFLSSRSEERAIEFEPGRARFVPALINRPFDDLNFIVNEDRALIAYENTNFIGTGRVIGQSDVIYATRFANADVLALLESGAVMTTALAETNVLDASVVPNFRRFALVTGSVRDDGIADINTNFAFREQFNFIGQDNDDTPFFFQGARGLSGRLINELRRNPDQDLFLVMQARNDFTTGDSGLPPLVGVDADGPFGNSFLSLNGSEFEPVADLNFAMQLRFSGGESSDLAEVAVE